MKFAVVLLVVLGLVAAGAATIFVQSTSLLKQKEVPTVDVLVALDDLQARTTLSETMVEVRKMTKTGLPQGYLSNWSQAAGKILKVAIVKGQPLTDSQFIPKNSIDDLLKPGMLAFPAPLPRRSTAVNLLYPGCIVDVFATFPLRDKERGDAVVTPLLQNIQVLAIADDTVIPPADEKGATAQATKKRASSSGSNVTVTLEVTARQAAALQLALERGTLGLAMRNPNDKGWNPMEPMVVKEGQLTASSEALDPQTLAWVTSIQRMLNPQMVPDPNTVKAVAATQPVPQGIVQAPDPNTMLNVLTVQQPIPGVQAKKSTMQITVIKGQKVEETEVDMPDENKEKQEEAPPEEGGAQ